MVPCCVVNRGQRALCLNLTKTADILTNSDVRCEQRELKRAKTLLASHENIVFLTLEAGFKLLKINIYFLPLLESNY